MQNHSTHKSAKGFTLIELLTSIAIIGVLAGVAIQQYSLYKIRGYDAHSKQALHDINLLCNAYWTENYISDECDLAKSKEYGFVQHSDVVATLPSSTLDTFCASAKHNSSPNTYSIDSASLISSGSDCTEAGGSVQTASVSPAQTFEGYDPCEGIGANPEYQRDKSEGEGSFGEPIEGAEVQALWSRAIAPFFDFQAGVRQDLTGPERTHAVIGIQGIAPYQFEVDAAAFVSTKGDVTARFEGELDQRITQRLILQPRAEIALSAQDIPELGIGAGLDRIEAGLRLRYEFAREFAPYVGVSQEWRIGEGADFARAAGEDPSVMNYVVGLRFWF